MGLQENLVLPEQITVQLIDSNGSSIRMSNVLFRITAFARRKNDYSLAPFATDDEGLATITKAQLESEVAADLDSGVMDHAAISTCSPIVEIHLLTDEEIRRAIEARSTIWKGLLSGERDRWQSIEQLLAVYKNANNHRLLALEPTLRPVWNGVEKNHSYVFPVAVR
jgi:hypothetical protein